MDLKALARELNVNTQCGNTPYTVDLVMTWVDRIVCLLMELLSDKFTSNAIIRLNPGSMQEICCYKEIRSLDAQTDVTGKYVIPFKTKSEIKIKKRFDKAGWKNKCASLNGKLPDAQFVIDEVIKRSGTLFEIIPPVPEYPTIYVLATVIKDLNDMLGKDPSNYNIPCWLEVSVVEWVKYEAAMMLAGDPESMAVAQMHKSTFAELLNIDIKIVEDELKRRGIVYATPSK